MTGSARPPRRRQTPRVGAVPASAGARANCPLLVSTGELPEVQRLAMRGDLHHPPAALVEVVVRYFERDRGAPFIARFHGLE